jgi:hypothetical protein
VNATATPRATITEISRLMILSLVSLSQLAVI